MSCKKTKILVFSPNAVENGRGGEISSMELASGLNKYYEVTFVHTNLLFSGKKILNIKAIKNKLGGVRNIIRINFATFNFSNYLLSFPLPQELWKFYKLIKEHDIVYFSITSIKMDLVFLFNYLLIRKINLIIGYRKPLYSSKLFSFYNLKYRAAILLYSVFKRRIYHHTLSKNTKKFLQKFYNSKVIHITHGIDLKDYNEHNFSYKKENSLLFIYIGYLDDLHKGVGELIRAIDLLLKENSYLHLSFEFTGMGPLSPEIEKLERKYPNHVKFNGYVSNELIPKFFKKGDVYLFTSRREPFPRSLMEALAANLIIICSKTIGSIELLKNKKFALFLEKLKSNEISKKIIEIYNLWISEPKMIKDLQYAAKDYVFRDYSTEKEIKEFRALIKQILSKN